MSLGSLEGTAIGEALNCQPENVEFGTGDCRLDIASFLEQKKLLPDCLSPEPLTEDSLTEGKSPEINDNTRLIDLFGEYKRLLTAICRSIYISDPENSVLVIHAPTSPRFEWNRLSEEKKGSYIKQVSEKELSQLKSELEETSILSLAKCNLTDGDLAQLLLIFPHLNILKINNNKLTTLPPLPKSLVELDVSHNKLTELEINGPTRLSVVKANNNQIKVLNEYPDTQKLDLSNNELTTVPEVIPPGMDNLDLSNNKINNSKLLVQGIDLSSLKIDLSGNKLTDFTLGKDNQSQKIGKPIFLDVLNLSENMLNNFPKIPTDLRIALLDLSNNQIREVGKGALDIVNQVKLGNNQLTAFPSISCGTIASHMHLDGNPLGSIDVPEGTGGSLQVLTLSNCGISEVDNLPRGLTFLDLSHNKLVEFPGIILSMLKLESLSLANNKISSVNHCRTIPGLGKLTFLDLSHNKLTLVPGFLSALELRELHLEGNKGLKVNYEALCVLKNVLRGSQGCQLKIDYAVLTSSQVYSLADVEDEQSRRGINSSLSLIDSEGKSYLRRLLS